LMPTERAETKPIFEPFDLHGLKTVALAERPSKVFHADLGRPLEDDSTIGDWLDSLPRQLAADSLRRFVKHLVRVKRENRTCVAALGGHVVKTGCSPYLIDLMRRGVVTAIAMNGAGAIHDLELAVAGRTSEDVGPRLIDGSFGMARETADLYAHAAKLAVTTGEGLGRSLGAHLDRLDCRHAESSLLVQAYRMNLPCTVHVAVGTDVVHMHPVVSGADLGEASYIDFRILTSVVATMEAGLWMNLGCAVVMPEVFLKAVSIVNNFGHSLDGLVSANLDMIQQYRGRVNVCERPSEESVMLTGHHEIMIPLVHSAVVAALAKATTTRTASKAA
jgi:deoxyhypusine synthase